MDPSLVGHGNPEPTDKFVARYRSAEQWDPNYYDEALGNFSTFKAVPSAPLDASVLRPEMARWQQGHKLSNQFIHPGNINPGRETFLPGAMFLIEHQIKPGNARAESAFVSIGSFFVSPEYSVSFVFAETLDKFGIHWSQMHVKKVYNPRGGRFRPIGVATLYVKFKGTEDPFFINVLVLGGSPVDAGAMFIMGKPDIDRIFGLDWTPSRC
ncbi:hypothetical protein B0T16DRAFT_461310 [Cercophora newfieldiana]|uniref:Uncharacterized protein n=1 Tax=Cercophora newfieldiana TaxID=92897 RepID=A0AA39XVV3_9PEZI|nr:hypothetical protein B0T16DRAFT_461310 [Cercophora newfieldiana]